MTNKFSFENLNVYKEALSLTSFIYEATNAFPKEEVFGLTSQLRRAVVSISLNIAEGSSRTSKDFCHFIDIAKGSCFESVTILYIAKDRKYISDEVYLELYSKCYIIAKMLSKLKSSLANNKKLTTNN